MTQSKVERARSQKLLSTVIQESSNDTIFRKISNFRVWAIKKVYFIPHNRCSWSKARSVEAYTSKRWKGTNTNLKILYNTEAGLTIFGSSFQLDMLNSFEILMVVGETFFLVKYAPFLTNFFFILKVTACCFGVG